MKSIVISLLLQCIFVMPCIGQTQLPRPPVLDPFQGLANSVNRQQAEITSEEMIGDLLTRQAPSDPVSFEMQTDFDEAKRLAVENNRPIFLIFGADWCGWCKKLEADLDEDNADTIFEKWIVVSIDVDDNPDIASQFQVGSLPNLQILDSTGEVIAMSIGYLDPTELGQWLDENFETAAPERHEILLSNTAPDEEGVTKLIVLLSNKSKSTRAAAIKRLADHRRQSSDAVVESFVNGRLVQKLAIWEILRTWNAPIESFDPWQPESYVEDSVMLLRHWAAKIE